MPMSTYDSRAFALELREKLTSAELRLWSRLRGRALGVRFRPQVPRGRYVIDFYCRALGLAVEVDGSAHAGREDYDEHRTRQLMSEFRVRRVVRFSNDDVLHDIGSVLNEIRAAIEELS